MKFNKKLESFPKPGEYFIKNSGMTFDSYKNRPRNISNPSFEVKAIGGWINYVLMKCLKISYPHYVANKNVDELE